MAGGADILRHWGLARRPFEDTADPRFFFESASGAEALARLELLAEDGSMGFGLLTGDVGSGKSFVSAVFAQALDPRRFACVYLPNAKLGFAQVLEDLVRALGGSPPFSGRRAAYDLLIEFRRVVEARVASCGRHLLVILDEAQEFSEQDLAELRCLQSAARGPTTLILVGQDPLIQTVRRLQALASRVGLGYHLRYLDAGETAPYLVHRLRAAGHPTGRVFAQDAAAAIAERSGGSPREINRLARLCLYRAAARLERAVTVADVLSVAEDQGALRAAREPLSPAARAA